MSNQENKNAPNKGQGKPAVPAPGKNPDFPGSTPVDPPPTGGSGSVK
jgi:hypothetical protein